MDSRNLGTRPDLVPVPRAGGVTEINVTPLIDVLLVLLVTGILAFGISRRSLPIQLPDITGKAKPFPIQIVLELANDGGYLVNRQPVPGKELPGFLAAVFRDRPAKLLFIKVGASRTYQDFIDAADLARAVGVTMVAEVATNGGE
jgi:biopolymer transport protein ExbD